MAKKHGVKMEYNQITPYIFLGTNACCQIHFKKELLDKGIKADISLEEGRIDAAWGVKYFLWLPTKDHTAPTMKQLGMGAKQIDFLVKNRIKVYIHCKNGHGRAPTLLAAYFISQGMNTRQAIEEIKKKRPEIHLWPAQVKDLNKFSLKKE